jgi:TolB-like protein
MSFFNELKRRNVIRVAIAYLVVGWLTMQFADVVLDNIDAPSWVFQVIMLVLAIGLPLVLVFAWAFEMTPEGIKKEKDVDRSQSITSHTGSKLDRTIIAVLLIALAWFTWDRYRLGQAVQPEPAVKATEQPQASPPATEPVDDTPVIAVLPFKATGSDDGGFLASGLHDDLLTRMAKLGAFRVISRTSMMEYADSTKNMRRIGEELGAGYILEGGVQAMGERVRINAQLIDALADEHIWAEIYNRELTANNLFDVQAELAVAIAQALQTELSPSDLALVNEVPTENMEAYNAYLIGIQKSEMKLSVGVQKDREAVEAFGEAVRLDPGFALAWAKLSTARIRADCCNYTPEQSKASLEALDRARTLQPGMLESELAWAEYLYRVMKEYGQALETLEVLGERLAGNLDALKLKAYLNRRLGRYDVGYETLQAAWRLEPRSPSIHLYLINYAWLVDDCDAAGRHVEQLLSLAPEAPASRVQMARYELECTGNAERAADLVRDLDFSGIGGWRSAFNAACQAGDAQLALSLNETEFANPGPAWPIWQQLVFAVVYRHLEPNEELAGRALGRAAELLESYKNDAALAQGEGFAALNSAYHSMKGDAAETRSWIEEHKRQYRSEYKGDLAEEAHNHIFYARSFAEAGLHDEAVEELRIMLEEPGGHRFPYVDGDPGFDVLRDHPGYVALRERFGD